jgi:hypothetical protein
MFPSQDDQSGEKEELDDGASNNLTREIDSWSNFEYALRQENRCCLRATASKDEFLAESLFMVLILQQQRTINELIAKISERKQRSLGKLTEWMDSGV